jgi:hypothetical protein
VTALADAIRTVVAPGDHLHFASTPSRSNVAIREDQPGPPRRGRGDRPVHPRARRPARYALAHRRHRRRPGDADGERLADATRACPWDLDAGAVCAIDDRDLLRGPWYQPPPRRSVYSP